MKNLIVVIFARVSDTQDNILNLTLQTHSQISVCECVEPRRTETTNGQQQSPRVGVETKKRDSECTSERATERNE